MAKNVKPSNKTIIRETHEVLDLSGDEEKFTGEEADKVKPLAAKGEQDDVSAVMEERPNLTAIAMRDHAMTKLHDELRGISEDEVVEVNLPKLDAKGDKVRDANGYLVTEPKKVGKRDYVEQNRLRAINAMYMANL